MRPQGLAPEPRPAGQHFGALCIITPKAAGKRSPYPSATLGDPRWVNVFYTLFLILKANLDDKYNFPIFANEKY